MVATAAQHVGRRRFDKAFKYVNMRPLYTASVGALDPFTSLDAAWRSMISSPNVTRAIDLAGHDAAYDVFLAHFGNQRRSNGSIQQDNLFQYAVGRATS